MFKHTALFTTIIWLGLSLNSACAAPPQILAAVVSANTSLPNFTGSELSLIYWRKKQYWPDGKRIYPVNLSSEHPLRQQFSRAVLGSLPSMQTQYWNELYYLGTSPPYVVNSEEAVLRYVAETKGAIGYVEACKADSRVKVVLWITAENSAAERPAGLSCNP